ncbi:MAG: PD-(D/E)XK nuclease family protein [Verrucomicrobiales bacterium]|nr:PD-(D/E)XK nuclease family protein [Verrucomicrobiales bacterium]
MISLPVAQTSSNVLGQTSDPLEYISASRLKCFQTCRLQYFFRYVAKIRTVTSPALLVGQVVHAVLQAWNLARWRGEDASVDAMANAFAFLWESKADEQKMQWKSAEEEEAEKAKAWRILEHYLQNSPIPLAEKPEAVEVVVERDLLAHGLPPLKGVIDLVRGGGRIVDFKTTARTPDESQARHLNDVQLGCYALLYREATGQPELGFELHHLVKTKTPKVVVTALEPMKALQIQKLLRVMESYVDGVGAEDFVPSPGMQCSFCDYFAQCQRWKGSPLDR